MRSRGFTIVELLVSIVVASIALVGIYFYYTTVQYSMREQSRISQAQLEARLGMELVAADLQRAGYLATPNSDVDPMVCRNNLVRIHPVIFHNGALPGAVFAANATTASVAVPNAAANTNLTPDDVLLFGNYLNANEYLAETINVGSSTIRLQPLLAYPDPSESDVVAQAAATLTDVEFQALFPFPGRAFLRIVNRHGFEQFTKIMSVSNFSTRTISVEPAPIQFSPTQPCGVEGWCEGCRVNVVNGVWYRLEQTDPVNEPLRTDLVRYYVDQQNRPIAATREVVVQYAVDFQVWFRGAVSGAGGSTTFDINLSPDVPDDSVIVLPNIMINPLNGDLASKPEAVRSAIVRLTVRTRIEDPRFPHQARPDRQQRVKSFELVTGSAGAAHVRTYTTEVQLPNISFANLW